MKTKLLYLLALLFTFTGCCENDPEPAKTYMLQSKKSVVTFPSGGGLTIDLNYRYNELNQIVAIDGIMVRDGETTTGTTTINYDSQGRLVFVENRLGTIWTITYNVKGQIERMVRKYASSEPYVYEHLYNSQNQLIQINSYQQTENTLTLVGTTVYTYIGDNRISIKRVSSSGTDNKEYTIVTDTYKRALPFLPHQITMEFFAAEVMAEPLLTQHNIISNEVMNIVQGNKLGVSYTSTYTYNDGGYPTSAVKTFEEGSVEKISYTYTAK